MTAGAPGRRRFLALAAGAAAAAAAPRRAGATERPVRGGVLKQIGLEPPTFDVHATASHQTQLVSSFVRRTLFKVVHGARYGPSDFTLAPDLALEASASADRRTYTITLRPGVRWESRPPVNGRELVAADVKFSLERALRKSPFASLLGPVERIDAPDRRTVRVHLADSFAPFVHNLAEPWTAIVPPEAEDRPGDPKAAESLIGCGPFVLERYEPGVKAVFSRNPTYHARGLPYLDKVEWLFIKDRPTQLALFRAGQVDLPSHDARIPRAEAAAFKKATAGYPIVVLGRARGALAGDARRPAALQRRAGAARAQPGGGPEDVGGRASRRRGRRGARAGAERHAAVEAGRAAARRGRPLSRARSGLARTLLAEAGFPAGLKIKCTSWPGYGPEYVDDLERLAGHLRRVGVELQIVAEEHAPYIRGSFLGRFEEASWGPSSLFTDVDGYLSSFFRSGQAGNRSHVADAQLDGMLEAQRRATSRRRASRSSTRSSVAPPPRSTTSSRRTRGTCRHGRRASGTTGRRTRFDRGAQLEVVWLDRA